jgi:hypothetical protein
MSIYPFLKILKIVLISIFFGRIITVSSLYEHCVRNVNKNGDRNLHGIEAMEMMMHFTFKKYGGRDFN